jgi:hypothetical protein
LKTNFRPAAAWKAETQMASMVFRIFMGSYFDQGLTIHRLEFRQTASHEKSGFTFDFSRTCRKKGWISCRNDTFDDSSSGKMTKL